MECFQDFSWAGKKCLRLACIGQSAYIPHIKDSVPRGLMKWLKSLELWPQNSAALHQFDLCDLDLLWGYRCIKANTTKQNKKTKFVKSFLGWCVLELAWLLFQQEPSTKAGVWVKSQVSLNFQASVCDIFWSSSLGTGMGAGGWGSSLGVCSG